MVVTPSFARAWRRLADAAPFLVIGTVVAIGFARVTANAPVWDDDLLTVHNPYLRSWWGAATLVSTDIWTASGKAEPSSFYRPLPMLSYLVDARLFGASALAFHAVNVALHALNASLLFVFLRSRRLSRGLVLPLATTLLFALAPIAVEAVAWISGRFDLLGTSFVLAALLTNRRAGAHAAACTTLLLALALLCKESFALGAAIVLLDDALVLRRRFRSELGKYLAFAAAVAAYLVARRVVGVMSIAALTGTGVHALAESFAFVLATYLRALVDPGILDPFRPYEPFEWLGTGAVLSLVGLTAAGLGFMVRRARRSEASDPRVGAIALGMGWLILGFLPVTPTGPNLEMVGDRYAYFPLLGVFIAGCATCSLVFEAALRHAAPERQLAARLTIAASLAALALLGTEALRTEARLVDWRDERSLFRASLRDDPGNAYALYSLGFLEAQEGDFAGAETDLGRSLARKPDAWRALNALCYVRMHEHHLQSAERLCRESLTRNAANPRAWINLASVYVNDHDWDAGREAASRAMILKPAAAEPHYLHAVCLANLGDLAGAREDLALTLAAEPGHLGAQSLLRQFAADGVPSGPPDETPSAPSP